jgi:hypothetical protein
VRSDPTFRLSGLTVWKCPPSGSSAIRTLGTKHGAHGNWGRDRDREGGQYRLNFRFPVTQLENAQDAMEDGQIEIPVWPGIGRQQFVGLRLDLNSEFS